MGKKKRIGKSKRESEPARVPIGKIRLPRILSSLWISIKKWN